MSKASIEPLDQRQLLASTTVADFRGLPRETTQIGSTLYFALDSEADGHLTYVDLVAYDLASGKKKSITRDNGKKFGAVQYHLSKVGDRLLIAERYLTGFGEEFDLWTLRPGEARAQRLVNKRADFIPEKFEVAGDRVFFQFHAAGKDASADGLYWFDQGKAGAAQLSYPNSKLRVGDFHGFGGGLAVFPFAVGTMTYDAKTLYVGSGLPGSLTHVKTLPSGLESIGGFSAAGFLVLNVQMPREHRVYTTLDGKTLSVMSLPGGPQSMIASPMTTDVPLVVLKTGEFSVNHLKNLKTGKLFEVSGLPTYWNRVGDSVYGVSTGLTELRDPEAVGGYVAPTGVTISNGTINVGSLDPSSMLVKIDAKGGPAQYFDTPSEGGRFYGADGFVEAGGLTYFRRGDKYREDSTRHVLASTDGSGFGTMLNTDIAAGPYAWNDKVYYMQGLTSSKLVHFTPDKAAIGGQVVIDPTAAKVITPSMEGLERRRVYLDRNNNGKFDKDTEPSQFTDYTGSYRFSDLKPGTYTVRLSSEAGWEPTRGWSKTITVQAGRAKTVTFGLRDTLKTGKIFGQIRDAESGWQAFLDTNRNALFDPGERSIGIDSNNSFEFDRLPAGTYLVRFKMPSSSSYYPTGVYHRFYDLFVAPGQRVEAN